MTKKLFFLFFFFALVTYADARQPFQRAAVKSVMKRVADWQIANPNKGAEHDDLDWTHAALYMGMTDWAALTEKEDADDSYYQWLLRIGRRNHFQVGKWMYHADFIAVGQPFIDLYTKYGNKKMIAPVMARANWVVENPSEVPLALDYGNLETLDRWSWCDALFMAPPVYAKLYALTKDKKYLDFLNREYKATYDHLYDREEHLFYRDRRYFDKREANGKKVFWGRGNGWVLGGLSEILQALPADEPSRAFYRELFVELATRVAALQSPDGYWHASLLDPASYPSPETSATGFIVYALAYGVNEGLLDRNAFMPVIEKGWKALVDAVEPDGKLGYVQPIGADPRKVTREMTEVYGVGAFLLAGCQIYRMACEDAMAWFRDAKFGLFIHWGLYSQTAGGWKGHPVQGGEHFMLYERIPLKEYAGIADDFNPVDFDAKAWVKAAKRAGMKYIVYTTKHHDGFAMYRSDCSDYNIVKRTPFGRDPLKELAEACKEEGIRLGLYYSLGRDWEDPDVPTNWPVKAGRSNTWDYPDEDAKQLPRYLERKVKPQLRELLTNYGEIAILWFDTFEMVNKQQSAELRRLIHSLQPDCLINNRIGNGMGDYAVMEQKLSTGIIKRPWEACMTMGRNWGYNKYDTLYKKPDVMVRHLVDVVSKGGNLLLNIGPDRSGRFPALTGPGLDAFHDWLKRNGESIYAASPWHVYGEALTDAVEHVEQKAFHDAEYDGTPQETVPDVRYTRKGNTVFAIVRHPAEKSFLLRSFAGKTEGIRKVTLLENGRPVSWKATADGLRIEGVRRSQSFPIYVLKVEYI